MIATMGTRLNAQVIIKDLQVQSSHAREVTSAHGSAEKDGTATVEYEDWARRLQVRQGTTHQMHTDSDGPKGRLLLAGCQSRWPIWYFLVPPFSRQVGRIFPRRFRNPDPFFIRIGGS